LDGLIAPAVRNPYRVVVCGVGGHGNGDAGVEVDRPGQCCCRANGQQHADQGGRGCAQQGALQRRSQTAYARSLGPARRTIHFRTFHAELPLIYLGRQPAGRQGVETVPIHVHPSFFIASSTALRSCSRSQHNRAVLGRGRPNGSLPRALPDLLAPEECTASQ